MPRINLPLNSNLNTEYSISDKIAEGVLFDINDQVYHNGGLRNTSKILFPSNSIITEDGSALRIEDTTLYSNDTEIYNYQDEFISKPLVLPTTINAITTDHLYSASVNGNVATITTYDYDNENIVNPVSHSIPIYNVSENKVTKLVIDYLNRIRVIQIAALYFTIDDIRYDISISSNAKLFISPTTIDIVEPTIQARTITNGTLTTIPNVYDAIQIDTIVYFTLMGDTTTAHIRKDIATDIYTQVRWLNPGSTNLSIYSQTYHPLEPFTIITNGEKYWWAGTTTYSYLENTIDPSGISILTSDYTAGSLTSLFNRTFNRNKFSEVYAGGQPIALSYNGVLITPVGSNYDYQYANDSLTTRILLDNALITISPNVTPTITHLGQSYYKINVANIYNLLDTATKTLLISSLDWNNRIKPEQILRFNTVEVEYQPSEITTFNSAFGANYEAEGTKSTSIITGSPSIEIRSDGSNKLFTYTTSRWQEANPLLPTIVDYYYSKGSPNAVYQTSGFTHEKAVLKGLYFPEPSLGMILSSSPVNSNYHSNILGISFINYLDYYNIGLNYNFSMLDAYSLTSLLTVSGDIFAISGATYLYTNNNIYAITFDGSVMSTRDYVATTGGMKYIGHNTSSAFFLSSDNYLWLFNGSYTLSLFLNLNRYNNLITSNYNPSTDDLVFLFENGAIRIRKNIISSISESFIKLSSSVNGTVFYSDTETYLLEPFIGEVYTPYKLSTAWLHVDDKEDTLISWNRIWIKLSDISTIKASVSTLNDYRSVSSDILLHGSELVITPKQIQGRAIKLDISSEELVNIISIVIDYEKIAGKAPSLTNRSK